MEIWYLEFQDGFEIRKTSDCPWAQFGALEPYLRKADGWTRPQVEQVGELLDAIKEEFEEALEELEEEIALLEDGLDDAKDSRAAVVQGDETSPSGLQGDCP
jgi:hypothetical protein